MAGSVELAGAAPSGGNAPVGGSGGGAPMGASEGNAQMGGSGGHAGAAGNSNSAGAGNSNGHCLAGAAQLPALKGRQDTDYYQQTKAPKGTISDVDFAWDASKNPASGPPQRSQQAVSPEVPAGFERMQVYTPPGDDPNGTTRYPVLDLNHGTGDTYKVWLASSAGSGNTDRNPGYGTRIYENLLDQHATVPMIIVTAAQFADYREHQRRLRLSLCSSRSAIRMGASRVSGSPGPRAAESRQSEGNALVAEGRIYRYG